MRKVRIRSPTKESPHDRGLSTVTVNRICGNSLWQDHYTAYFHDLKDIEVLI